MRNINPKKMQKLMKKMNMNVREVPAQKVIIECKDKEITIENPEVVIADMLGKDVYQISGKATEHQKGVNKEDVEMVMEKTGKSKETVEKTLEALNNDLARAITELKKK